jgi:hypothetical protein
MLSNSQVREYLRCATLGGVLPSLTGKEIGQLLEAARKMQANLCRLGKSEARLIGAPLDAAVKLLAARKSETARA